MICRPVFQCPYTNTPCPSAARSMPLRRNLMEIPINEKYVQLKCPFCLRTVAPCSICLTLMPLDKPHSASRDGDIHLIECPECLWPHPTDPRLAAAKLSIPHIESNVLTSLARVIQFAIDESGYLKMKTSDLTVVHSAITQYEALYDVVADGTSNSDESFQAHKKRKRAQFDSSSNKMGGNDRENEVEEEEEEEEEEEDESDNEATLPSKSSNPHLDFLLNGKPIGKKSLSSIELYLNFHLRAMTDPDERAESYRSAMNLHFSKRAIRFTSLQLRLLSALPPPPMYLESSDSQVAFLAMVEEFLNYRVPLLTAKKSIEASYFVQHELASLWQPNSISSKDTSEQDRVERVTTGFFASRTKQLLISNIQDQTKLRDLHNRVTSLTESTIKYLCGQQSQRESYTHFLFDANNITTTNGDEETTPSEQTRLFLLQELNTSVSALLPRKTSLPEDKILK